MAGGNDEVDFAVRLLTDELQKSAAAAASELKLVDAAMEATGKTEREVRAAMKSLAAAEKEAGDAAKKLAAEQGAAAKKHADEHSDAMKRVGEASAHASDEIVAFAAKSAVALAGTVVGLAVAGEKFAIEAADFKEHTVKALELMLGSKSAGEQAFALLRQGANTFGVPLEQMTKSAVALQNVGFSMQESATIMSAAMDVAVGTNDASKGEMVTHAIEKIARTGKFDGKALKEALRGIGTEDELARALQQIGGTKGLGIEQIKRDMEAGKIAAGDGVNAILSVVQTKFDKGGPVGSLAKEMADNDLGGQIQKLKNQFTDIFADTAVDGPMVKMLQSLNDLLGEDTESGQEIRKVLGDAFTAIGDAIAKITPEDIEKTVKAMVKMADAGMGIAKAFSGELGKNLNRVLGPLANFLDGGEESAGKTSVLVEVLETLAAVVGKVAGSFIGSFLVVPTALSGLYDGIKDVFDRIPHSWDEVEKWWSDLSLVDVGSDLVDGLWEGIKKSWRDFLGKFEDLVDLLPASVKHALGIASPSKVMMELGGYAGEGFTAGISGENDNARKAMLELVAPPPPSPTANRSSVVVPQVSIATGGGGSFSVGELHIHFDGAAPGSPQDIGAAITEHLRKLARERGAINEEAA